MREKWGTTLKKPSKNKQTLGLFGYKVWITVALLMGEGLYMLGKAIAQGERCCLV